MLASAGMFALLVAALVLWSQTSRVRYLDINSGATKEAVEVLGIPVASSPGLPAVHEVPGIDAEWRCAGKTDAQLIACGRWGRAAADYQALGLMLELEGVDESTRAEVFRGWRGQLARGGYERLEFVHADDAGEEDWRPVAAELVNDVGERVLIVDLRR